MAIPNKTRWMEKWHNVDGVQVASFKIVDGANYTERTLVTLYPIKHIARKPQAPQMILRDPMNVKDYLAKLDADRIRSRMAIR